MGTKIATVGLIIAMICKTASLHKPGTSLLSKNFTNMLMVSSCNDHFNSESFCIMYKMLGICNSSIGGPL